MKTDGENSYPFLLPYCFHQKREQEHDSRKRDGETGIYEYMEKNKYGRKINRKWMEMGSLYRRDDIFEGTAYTRINTLLH